MKPIQALATLARSAAPFSASTLARMGALVPPPVIFQTSAGPVTSPLASIVTLAVWPPASRWWRRASSCSTRRPACRA